MLVCYAIYLTPVTEDHLIHVCGVCGSLHTLFTLVLIAPCWYDSLRHAGTPYPPVKSVPAAGSDVKLGGNVLFHVIYFLD